MTDDEPSRRPSAEHPILSGLAALVGVTVVVGIILGGGALAAAKVMGVDKSAGASDDSSNSATLYIPSPGDEESSDGPYITLAPGEGDSGQGSSQPTAPETSSKPEKEISLSAAQTAVGPMEPIDLSGSYPGGGGSILKVQQFQSGAWADFPVTIPVDGDTFSTFIQASAVGLNRFRVVDSESDLASNQIKVQIG